MIKKCAIDLEKSLEIFKSAPILILKNEQFDLKSFALIDLLKIESLSQTTQKIFKTIIFIAAPPKKYHDQDLALYTHFY